MATTETVDRIVAGDERRDQVRLLLRRPNSAIARRLRTLVLLLLLASALYRNERVPMSQVQRGALCRRYEKIHDRERVLERRRGIGR